MLFLNSVFNCIPRLVKQDFLAFCLYFIHCIINYENKGTSLNPSLENS